MQGFPENKEQFDAFDYYQIQPHLFIIFDDEEEVLLDIYSKLVQDPLTGRFYLAHEVTNPLIKARLVKPQEKEEHWL